MADPAALDAANAANAANAAAQDPHQDKSIVKRRTLDDAQKYEICVYVKENSDNGNRLTNKAVALYILGRYHIKVDESTVSRLRAQSDKRLSSAELANPKAKRHRQVLFPELERLLVERITDMIGKVAITDVLILQNGKELAQELDIPAEQLSFSDGWLSKFKTRHGLRGTVMPSKTVDHAGPSNIAPARRRNYKRHVDDNHGSSSAAKPKRRRAAHTSQDVPLPATQPLQVRDPIAAPEMGYNTSADLAASSRVHPALGTLTPALEQAGSMMPSEADEAESSSSSDESEEDSSESEHEDQDLGVEQHLLPQPSAPQPSDASHMDHGHGALDSMVNAAAVAAQMDGNVPNVYKSVRPMGATVISLEEQRQQQQQLRLQHQQYEEMQQRQQQELQLEHQHYQQQEQQQEEQQRPQRPQRHPRQARQNQDLAAAEGSSSTGTSGTSVLPMQPPVSMSALGEDLALVDLGIAAAGMTTPSAAVAAPIPAARRSQPAMTPARAALSLQLTDPVAASFQPEPLVEFSEAAQCVYTLRVFMQQQGFDRAQVENLRDIYLTLSIKRRQQREQHEQQQQQQQLEQQQHQQQHQQQQQQQQQQLQLENTVQHAPPSSSSSQYTQKGKPRQRQQPRRR